MVSFLKKPLVYVPLILVCIIGVVLYVRSGSTSKSAAQVYAVEPTNLVQTVAVTGRVVPLEDAVIGFERGGTVMDVLSKVGDTVTRGQVLARLESGEVAANLSQAKAALAVARATLAQAKRGARVEDIAISEVRVVNSERALVYAKQSLADVVRQAYTAADDAIRNKTDAFFTNPAGRTPALSFPVTDLQLKIDIETQRFALTDVMTAWKSTAAKVSSGDPAVVSLGQAGAASAAVVKGYLDKIALAVNSLTPNASLSQTTIDAYKASAAAARSAVNAASDSFTAAFTAISSAEDALILAQRELALKRAGSSPEDIDAKEAQVAQAAAGVANLEAQIKKTVLVAPFDGTVTRMDAKVGETVLPNAPVAALIGAGGYKIEANVPEADIAKISLEDTATTTLDAYGSDVAFPTIVSGINPAETLVDNVAAYKVTFLFREADIRVRSGMTANIDIMTESRNNVLAVPLRAVTTSVDGKRTVSVVGSNGISAERPVVLGIRAEGGLVEIVSGLSAGESVIVTR